MLKHELGAVYYGIFQMQLYFPLLCKNTLQSMFME